MKNGFYLFRIIQTLNLIGDVLGKPAFDVQELAH